MLTDIINLDALIYHANNSSTIMEECQPNFKENVDAFSKYLGLPLPYQKKFWKFFYIFEDCTMCFPGNFGNSYITQGKLFLELERKKIFFGSLKL